MRRTNCCHGFLACNLKFFNFLQFFVGISIVVYSLYALSQWQNHTPIAPPPSIAPSPSSPEFRFYSLDDMAVRDRFDPLFSAADLVSGSDELPDLGFGNLPATWFIYCLMGVGVVLASYLASVMLQPKRLMGVAFVFILFSLLYYSSWKGLWWHLLHLIIIGRRFFLMTQPVYLMASSILSRRTLIYASGWV